MFVVETVFLSNCFVSVFKMKAKENSSPHYVEIIVLHRKWNMMGSQEGGGAGCIYLLSSVSCDKWLQSLTHAVWMNATTHSFPVWHVWLRKSPNQQAHSCSRLLFKTLITTCMFTGRLQMSSARVCKVYETNQTQRNWDMDGDVYFMWRLRE